MRVCRASTVAAAAIAALGACGEAELPPAVAPPIPSPPSEIAIALDRTGCDDAALELAIPLREGIELHAPRRALVELGVKQIDLLYPAPLSIPAFAWRCRGKEWTVIGAALADVPAVVRLSETELRLACLGSCSLFGWSAKGDATELGISFGHVHRRPGEGRPLAKTFRELALADSGEATQDDVRSAASADPERALFARLPLRSAGETCLASPAWQRTRTAELERLAALGFRGIELAELAARAPLEACRADGHEHLPGDLAGEWRSSIGFLHSLAKRADELGIVLTSDAPSAALLDFTAGYRDRADADAFWLRTRLARTVPIFSSAFGAHVTPYVEGEAEGRLPLRAWPGPATDEDAR